MSSVPSGRRRAILFLGIQLTKVNNPPIRILPSGNSSISNTSADAAVPVTSATNVGSIIPVLVTRTIRFLAVPLTPVNNPPIRIFQSGCCTIASTILLMLPVKLGSTIPVELRRATRFLTAACTPVNCHPIRIFPSDCAIIALMVVPHTNPVKLTSSEPLDFKRARSLLVIPPAELNKPPTRIFPSDCRTTF